MSMTTTTVAVVVVFSGSESQFLFVSVCFLVFFANEHTILQHQHFKRQQYQHFVLTNWRFQVKNQKRTADLAFLDVILQCVIHVRLFQEDKLRFGEDQLLVYRDGMRLGRVVVGRDNTMLHKHISQTYMLPNSVQGI
jgi:hypothetical protein